MALPVRLTLCPFLQDWDGAELALNLLVAPQTNPLAPPAPGLTPFAATDFTFEVRFVADVAQLPTFATPAAAHPLSAPAAPQAVDICKALATQFEIDPGVGPVDPKLGAPRVFKYAPPAYRDATGYGGTNRHLLTDDSYRCAMKADIPVGTSLKAEPLVMSWGRMLGQALRQPLLSNVLGLVRTVRLAPPPAVIATGGWVYVTIAAGTPWHGLLGTPGAVRHYAARIPPLGTTARPLFTPVMFPVGAVAPGGAWDDLFREAIEYDDGFAKAVYARQPNQADPLVEEDGDDPVRPATDLGLQLGWDDEQVVTWLNRQTDSTAADAPMGVLGYRVDVREPGAPVWDSLVRVSTAVTLDGNDIGTAELDWRVEVAPNRLLGDQADRSWLPSFLTAWTGPALVGTDETAARVRGLTPEPEPIAPKRPTVALRYGRDYEFRVRLADLTGGGPALDHAPRNGGPQPLCATSFLRYVRPAGVRFTSLPPIEPDPAAPPQSLHVTKPLLAYPACVMAGGDEADLIADIATAKAQGRPSGLPDPDVDQLEITVEVAAPQPGRESVYRPLYTTTRPFAADGTLTIDFDWTDIADVRDLAAAPAGPVALPTSRDVRLQLTPLASDKPGYFGAPDARRGEASMVRLRQNARDERDLLAQGGGSLVEAFFLQPLAPVDPAVAVAQKVAGLGALAPTDPLGRLAAALDLDRHEATLRGRKGQRLVIGAHPLMRHVVGPDGASLTFANANEMTRLWVVAVMLELRRDWSWDGLDHIRIARDGVEVGRIAGSISAAHEAQGDDRGSSTLLFLDAIDPTPAPGQFPRALKPDYTITPVFRAAPDQEDAPLTAEIRLPVTIRPAQVPKVVSAGLALSPYRRDPAYSQTEERRKAVWLEFDRAPDDPETAYFCRVLAASPDPVLTDVTENVAPIPDMPLPIDPEPMRRIVPGQANDGAGRASMQRLIPTSSPVHFLLPLPPGLDDESPELFGFFAYEFRLGYAELWSTAQAFAGRAARVSGIQHAPPPLACSVARDKSRLTVSASFADPVKDGRSLRPETPVTELWALLYAQVHQADGGDRRNILLGSRKLVPPRRGKPGAQGEGFAKGKSLAHGATIWSSAEVTAGLAALTLGPDAPLSCLVVETMPGEQPYQDPLGQHLGYERFLRTSPLTAVPAIC